MASRASTDAAPAAAVAGAPVVVIAAEPEPAKKKQRVLKPHDTEEEPSLVVAAVNGCGCLFGEDMGN